MSKADQVAALRVARASANDKLPPKEKSHAGNTHGKNHKVRDTDPERQDAGLSIQGASTAQPIEAVGSRSDLSRSAGQVAIDAASSVKRGRPRVGEIRAKPWLECEPPVSKSTWYRWKREKRE